MFSKYAYQDYKDSYRKNNVSWWLEHYIAEEDLRKFQIEEHLTMFGTELKLSLNDRINSRGDYIK